MLNMGMNQHNIGVIASSRQSTGWTNLVSWWKMTETSGGIAADSHGSDDVTITGASQTSSGLVFDGSGDYGAMSMSAFGTSDFTIIMRIATTYDAGVGRAVIAGPTNSFIFWSYEGRVVEIELAPTSTNTNYFTTDTMTYGGTVNFVAIVKDGTSLRFNVNGSNTGAFGDPTVSENFSAGATRFGTDPSSELGDFEGTLRDVCLFSDAKSDAYLTAFWNSGSFTEYEDGDPL